MPPTPSLYLDRMAIEEVGLNPEKLAAAIHMQLKLKSGPVRVHEIARALDIEHIREEPLTNLEGALLTTPERTSGSILVNRSSSRERRRFSVAHELGHFLITSHRPISEEGFQCSSRDMAGNDGATALHRRQESEANRFAISLLAPQHLLRKFLAPSPDLLHILAMAADLEISKEAAARRYVEQHTDELAVVFGMNGRVLYSSSSRAFPSLGLPRGAQLPAGTCNGQRGRVGDLESADPADWLRKPGDGELWTQTLVQQGGYSITLLHVDETADADAEDDTFGRFSRR